MAWINDLGQNAIGGFNGLSETVTTHITGGPPKQSYLGGSQEALDAQRAQLGGIGQASYGAGTQNAAQGGAMLGQAGGFAQADRDAAMGYSAQGQQLGMAGIGGQNLAVSNARGLAGQSTDSLAQMQLQQQSNANQRAMMAQAASARGGNQAAAMRQAQTVGANMQLQTNAAAGQMRAQEQQAALQRQLAVEQMAAGVGGQQAGLGYGMQGQGLGMAQQSTAQIGQLGAQQGQLGVSQQNVGLGAYGVLNDGNKAQLETDRGWASADSAARSPAAAFGGILGGVTQLWGGGGGK